MSKWEVTPSVKWAKIRVFRHFDPDQWPWSGLMTNVTGLWIRPVALVAFRTKSVHIGCCFWNIFDFHTLGRFLTSRGQTVWPRWKWMPYLSSAWWDLPSNVLLSNFDFDAENEYEYDANLTDIWMRTCLHVNGCHFQGLNDPGGFIFECHK